MSAASVINDDTTGSEVIRIIFNGPALAGVGATTDAGLSHEKYHLLMWDTGAKTGLDIIDTGGELTVIGENGTTAPSGTPSHKKMLQNAIYNVDSIYKFDETSARVTEVSVEDKQTFRRDLVAIVFVMQAYNYYDNECRQRNDEEARTANAIPISDYSEYLNLNTINRAATFLLARMHTKYQTNHVLGGSVMQASMASAVRSYYNVTPAIARTVPEKSKVNFYASGLHWALHPANERLLIPAVISNSKIKKALVMTHGPPVTIVGKEEYFTIRSTTPPSSTHHYYVAAAAVQHLKPLGILEYMPDPSRFKTIVDGMNMIRTHGAQLHPAARHWGLERITANQKIMEPLCADLGYAVSTLMSASSLASSPILQKRDGLDGGWKTFVDALRAAQAKHGDTMMAEDTLQEIMDRIAPSSQNVPALTEITKLMISNSPFQAAEPGTP